MSVKFFAILVIFSRYCRRSPFARDKGYILSDKKIGRSLAIHFIKRAKNIILPLDILSPAKNKMPLVTRVRAVSKEDRE